MTGAGTDDRAMTTTMSSSSWAIARWTLIVLGLVLILLGGVLVDAFGQAAASVATGLLLALLLELVAAARGSS